jgi:Fe-S oxidoreductase
MLLANRVQSRYPFAIERPIEFKRTIRFLDVFSAILKHSDYKYIFDLYSRLLEKCSRCVAQCPLYISSGDHKDIPCYRAGLLLRIYQRHFTAGGWLKSHIAGGGALDEADIDELLESYYQCTGCRRCTQYCPMGIDFSLITHLGRYILSETGLVPQALWAPMREQLDGETGNTASLSHAALDDVLQMMEAEILRTKGVRIARPMDLEDADYLFMPFALDFLEDPGSLMGMLCVLQASGQRWTMGSGALDAANFGFFCNDDLLGRIVRKQAGELGRLRARHLLVGDYGETFWCAQEFVAAPGRAGLPPVLSMVDMLDGLIRRGLIDLDTEAVWERVCFQDSCHGSATDRGAQTPRTILASFVKNIVEMHPHGRHNLCCGGGGGTVWIDETQDYRMNAAGRQKAEQLRAAGADLVVAACSSCRKQITQLIAHHALPMKCVGLFELVYRAVRLKQSPDKTM